MKTTTRSRTSYKAEAEILRRLQRWRDNPVIFVKEVFAAEPDAPQADALMALAKKPRVAMASSKNTGKTCTMAWAVWWFMSTRQQPRVTCTSVSEANLKANLWSELSKWYARSPLMQAWFAISATQIVARQIVAGSPGVDPAKTWWCQARSFEKHADRQQQSMTLAGIHEDHMLFVIDESSGVPDAVMASAEAALAGISPDQHILQGGNTTHLTGPLYRACTKERAMWHVVRMNGDPDDPNRSARVDIQWARDQIAKYDGGRNNPWVMINVLGLFPPHSINALIGPDLMEEAMRRSYREHDIAPFPRVLGIDVAREGDDLSVMFPRQGLVAFTPTVWRNVDGIQGAAAVSRKWDEWGADGCFVDNTGGFGASWIDCLRLLGRQPIPVLYNGEPHDRRYYNKRCEMYFDCVQWIKEGGQLPPCPELVAQMTEITYTFRAGSDRMLLEDKTQYKERTGFSPDHADALVETFAEPIQKINAHQDTLARRRRNRFRSEYDPYSIKQDEVLR